VVFRKGSDLNRMGASQAYVFIDEHPDSVNYGDFAVSMNDGAAPGSIYIIDYPASNHGTSGALSFADGHAESWRFVSPDTIRIGRMPPYIQSQTVRANDPDLRRFHAASLKVPR